MFDLLEAHVKFSVRFLAQSTFIFTAIPESQSMDVLSRRPAHRPYRYKYRAQALTPESREGIPSREPHPLSLRCCITQFLCLSVGKETAPTLYGWGGVSEMMGTTNSQNKILEQCQLALRSSDWLVSAIKGTPMYKR